MRVWGEDVWVGVKVIEDVGVRVQDVKVCE